MSAVIRGWLGRMRLGYLALVWTVFVPGWLLMYGAGLGLLETIRNGDSSALRVTGLAGVIAILVLAPALLFVFTWRWLHSDAVRQRLTEWHVGQVAGTWFAGGFAAVLAFLGLRELGTTREALGLAYLLFYVALTALVVPALLTLRWLATTGSRTRFEEPGS